MKGRTSLWAVVFVTIVLMVGSELPTPLYQMYSKQYHFSQVVLTLVYAAYVVGVVLGLVFFGRLSDQIGRRYTAVPAIVLAILATILFPLIHGPALLFVARFLYGISAGIASGTTAAWISDLYPSEDLTAGSALVSEADMGGQGIGPILTGVLAEWAPWPTRLTYLVFLVMLVPTVYLAWKAQETVEERKSSLREVSFKPRFGVPREQLAGFIGPAATAFSIFALLGFYTALTPTLLTSTLHKTSHFTAGAVVTELYAAAVLTVMVTRKVKSRPLMLSALAILVPGVATLIAAELAKSMALLMVATTLGGIAGGLGFRGSLEVVSHLSPPDRRAEMMSTYFLVDNIGVTLPVVGVGILSQLASQKIADITFAIVVAAFAVAAFIMGKKYSPDE